MFAVVLSGTIGFRVTRGICNFTVCEEQEISSIKKRKLSTATMRACCVINFAVVSVQTSVPAGTQPDALRSTATTPTSTQLCSVKFPFDISPGICFLCWKKHSLRRRDPLVRYIVIYFVYSTVIVPYKSYLCMWQRI